MGYSHMNLVFPQWQGSWPDSSTYNGAQDLVARYLENTPYTQVKVSTDPHCEIEKNIYGYPVISRQLSEAKALIEQAQPDTLFTIGGGCDADVTSIAYMNRKLAGNLTVLWLDAHADLNLPVTSASKLFFGMPVRTLIGEGDTEIIRLLDSKLAPSQVIQLGVRDIDPPEKEYIASACIRELTVSEVEQDISSVISAIRENGRDNLYIHLDLDVLEPALFPYVPLPAPAGLAPETLRKLLRRLRAEFHIPGIGLFEYMPSPEPGMALLEEIFAMGKALKQR